MSDQLITSQTFSLQKTQQAKIILEEQGPAASEYGPQGTGFDKN